MQETFPPPGRSRRVRRMKRYNTVMLIFSVLILTALSGCLLARIYRQDETIGRLSAQVGQLSRAVDERQELLELMEEELQRLREEISAGAGQQAGTDPGQEMQLPEGEEGPEEGGEVEAAHKVYLTFDDGPQRQYRRNTGYSGRVRCESDFFCGRERGRKISAVI